MVGLVFAMEEEAKQVLSAYEMEKVNILGRDFYVEQGNPDHDKILAVIAGIGKVNVQVATSLLITLGCNKLINISTCGCTSDLYKPGDLVIPNTFFDGDFDLFAFDTTTKDPALVNRLILGDPVNCYTYSTFITDDRAADGIVDMEAYGFVAQADAYDIPRVVIKVVSDGGDSDEFDQNVDSIITRHISKIREIVEGN